MQIGAAWLKTTQAGEKYMSVNIEYPGAKIQAAMFKNKEKKTDNHPDYIIVWNPLRKPTLINQYVSKNDDNDDDYIPF